MPQPGGNSRPQVDWWWDGSDRGDFWAWVVVLAGSAAAFSLGALLTSGGAPMRGIALANLVNGVGVVLAPTLIALRRLDRQRRLGELGGGLLGHHEVRRALHRSLSTLGLVDEERPLAARPARRPPPRRPAPWYQALAACWAAFVLLDVSAAWTSARELFVPQDPGTDGLRAGVDVVALPILLAWLVVGMLALGQAARVAHWRAKAERGARGRAGAAPIGRRLAADGRRGAGVTLARWRGLEDGPRR
jgi:hypothetical protein